MTAAVAGEPVDLGGPRQRAVLAALLLARRRVLPEARILDLVWAGEAPPAPTTLHGYVKQLRRALEPHRAPRAASQLLVRQGPGYVLRLGGDDVDAERFAGLVARGVTAMREQDPATALQQLDEALALWRGPAYADFTGYAFARPEAARLAGLRLDATEERYAALLALGEHAATVGSLERHVAEHPFRERPRQLLALALYRAGRQRDALAALREAREVFADELGIDPGPALRQLETDILRQDPALTGPAAPTGVSTTRVAEVPERRHNVPFAVSALVGRSRDLRVLDDLLAGARLVTVTGSGGIGKTTLALEVARRRRDPDGPWVVELAGLTSPELLVETVAAALEMPAVATVDQLATVLAPRELLLVVDNCEHLLAATAQTVATLLARCGGLRVLATSREPLRLPGEVVFEVPVLPSDHAVELFDQRAAASPHWAPTAAQRETIRVICAELDGLPLAVELAAAHCQVLSVEQIAAGLDDRFALLADGPATAPARHRGLAEAIDWSYHLLSADERALFGRLSVFSGGFDLDAAQAVAGPAVFAPLAALVRKSLVSVEPATTPRRYRMLETLRQYARGRLDPTERAAGEAAHREWMLRYAEEAERHVRGPESATVLLGLAQRQAEIRAAFTSALAAGDGEYALRLGAALALYWYRTGQIAEGDGWLRAAFAAAPQAEPAVRARALLGTGGLAYLAGDFAAAGAAMREAVEEAERAGEVAVGALALAYRALFGGIAAPVEAIPDAQAAVAAARAAAQPSVEAEALMALGMLRRLAGQIRQARADLAESVRVARQCGHGFVEVSSTWLGMKAALDGDDPVGALTTGVRVLELLDRDGDVTSWLVIVHTAAAALAMTGRAPDGAALLAAVERHGARHGFAPTVMDPLDAPGHAALVRAALTDSQWADARARGRHLSRGQVNDVLTGHLPAAGE